MSVVVNILPDWSTTQKLFLDQTNKKDKKKVKVQFLLTLDIAKPNYFILAVAQKYSKTQLCLVA